MDVTFGQYNLKGVIEFDEKDVINLDELQVYRYLIYEPICHTNS